MLTRGTVPLLRILQVITDDDRRGAQVFATDLAPALQALGHDVRTVALAPGDTRGLDVPVLGRRRLGVDTLRALRQELRAADVAVAHGSSTLPACAAAGLGTGTPFVYRQISDSLFWASDPVRKARVRIGLGRAAHVVALWWGSAATLTENFGVPVTKITVVPNGVPPARFAPPVDDAEVVAARTALGLSPTRATAVALGALVPEKGVDLAIEAVALVDDVQLLVAGDGPERGRLEALAERRAPGRVVFTGSLPEARAALVAADVVLLPSRGGDSMPAVLIEAGLVGRPAVSTPIGAIPEVVLDGTTGRIVAAGTEAPLADALRALTDDPGAARAMGAAAREHCLAKFAIEPVAAQWAAVLNASTATSAT